MNAVRQKPLVIRDALGNVVQILWVVAKGLGYHKSGAFYQR